MRNCVLRVFSVVGLVLVTANAAQAHAVHIDWKMVGTELFVVASFDDDLPADGAEVVLRGPDGRVVATGKTDDSGTWKCPKPAPGSYELIVRAFANHEKTVRIDILPPSAEANSPATAGPWVWLLAGAGVASLALL